MIQRARRLEGMIAECPGCKGQPFHVTHGTAWHFMECCRCGVRTAKYPALQLAVEAWGAAEFTDATAGSNVSVLRRRA